MPMGVFCGLILGDKTAILKDLTIYIIGFILAISTSSASNNSFLQLKNFLKPTLVCILLNYVIYGIIVLGAAYYLIQEYYLWLGFIVIAATPPAIAIIPFSINLRGESQYAIMGVFGANLAAVFITPLVLLVFLKTEPISSAEIMKILVKILFVPILLSRVFRWKSIYPFIDKYRGNIVDYGFFLVSLTVIGVSRDLLFHNPELLIIPFSILFMMMFILGGINKLLLLRLNKPHSLVITKNLMLTVKNAGFASVVSLSLFDNYIVAIPAAILSILLPLHYIWEYNTRSLFRENILNIHKGTI